jgi:hypothetical protein
VVAVGYWALRLRNGTLPVQLFLPAPNSGRAGASAVIDPRAAFIRSGRRSAISSANGPNSDFGACGSKGQELAVW